VWKRKTQVKFQRVLQKKRDNQKGAFKRGPTFPSPRVWGDIENSAGKSVHLRSDEEKKSFSKVRAKKTEKNAPRKKGGLEKETVGGERIFFFTSKGEKPGPGKHPPERGPLFRKGESNQPQRQKGKLNSVQLNQKTKRPPRRENA